MIDKRSAIDIDTDDPMELAALMLACATPALRDLTPSEKMRTLVDSMLQLRYLAGDRGILKRLAHAYPIRCEIRKVDVDKRCQRLAIEFVAENEGGKIETIRSDRIDGYYGELVRDIWRPFAHGGQAVIYKCNTPAPDGAKGPNGEPVRSYRNAVWVTRAHRQQAGAEGSPDAI